MKRILPTLLMMVLLTGCRQQPSLPEATIAAYDLYLQFADQEGLTVALMGDYKSDSLTLNAVMLQAQDSLNWLQLVDQLGMTEAFHRAEAFHRTDSTHWGIKTDDHHFIDSSTYNALLFLENKADLIAQRLQRFRESGDSSLSPVSPSPLLESWMKEKKVGTGITSDENKMTIWIFVYCDIKQLRDIFHFIYSNVWIKVDGKEQTIYNEIMSYDETE